MLRWFVAFALSCFLLVGCGPTSKLEGVWTQTAATGNWTDNNSMLKLELRGNSVKMIRTVKKPGMGEVIIVGRGHFTLSGNTYSQTIDGAEVDSTGANPAARDALELQFAQDTMKADLTDALSGSTLAWKSENEVTFTNKNGTVTLKR